MTHSQLVDAARGDGRMTRRPRLIDFFCKAGGTSMGYWRAGFDVIGVDSEDQPNYPFPFWKGDAMELMRDEKEMRGFDAAAASPPCQAFTQMSARWRGKGGKADSHPNLLTPTIAALSRLDIPWCVENVVGARRHMRVDLRLHGGLFGLGVHRPRLFQSNVLLLATQGLPTVDPIGVYGARAEGRRLFTRKSVNGKVSVQRAAHSAEGACAAMGIDWRMTWDEAREAIPPHYTEFIGRQLIRYVTR